MPRIKCHYADCVFVDEGYCSAAAVEIDPDTGCATYSPTDDAAAKVDEFDDEDETEEWDEEEGDEEDDDWLDDEDEF
ncbi:MAG: hypothetical protein IPL71_03260 [Anaerolineales bacterium]|uniref:hypothetical protein n=1 Tax=Candidatus Villigracilis proximus TaxID=3140683 RepID=UPI003135C7C1|nr:hypothetical protein [Anaerolineales bacterium]